LQYYMMPDEDSTDDSDINPEIPSGDEADDLNE
jgi:hypothetical protein